MATAGIEAALVVGIIFVYLGIRNGKITVITGLLRRAWRALGPARASASGETP